MLDKEIARLSISSGRDEATIRAEIQSLLDTGQAKSEEGALAIWKSRNRRLLGGITTDFTGMVIAVSDPREVTVRSGETRKVVSIEWFVTSTGKEYELRRMSLWEGEERDRTEIASKLIPKHVYTFKGKIFPYDNERILLIGDSIKPSDAEFPTLEQLVEHYGTTDLAKVYDYINTSAFFYGTVGNIMDSPYSDGIELSSIGADPITVWFPKGMLAQEKIDIGDNVVVYGYVSLPDGKEARINGRLIYKVEEQVNKKKKSK